MSVISQVSINPEYIKLRWQEPYVSSGLNRKYSGIIPDGIYRGFGVVAGPASRQVTVTTDDPYGWQGDPSGYAQGNYDALSGYSVAVFESSANFQVTIDIAAGSVSGNCVLDFTGQDSVDLYAVVDCQFAVGQWTTGQIKIVDQTEINAHPDLLVIAKIAVPSIGNPVLQSNITYDDLNYPRTLPYATLLKYGYMSPMQESRLVGCENNRFGLLGGGGTVEHDPAIIGKMTWGDTITVRFQGTSAVLSIPAGNILLNDGEMAYINIPEPLVSSSVSLQKTPISDTTLRDRNKFWLFHRVGSVVDSRGGLQFEPGEKRQLEDILIGNNLWFSEVDRLFFDGSQFNWYIANSLVGRITNIGDYVSVNDVQALNGAISLIDVNSRLSAVEASIAAAVTYDEFVEVSGVGGQQDFIPLPNNQTFDATSKDLKVYINGVKKIIDEDYTQSVSGVSGVGVGVHFLYNIPQWARVNFRLEKSMGGAGESGTMANVGTGAGLVYKQKIGSNFDLRKLKAGTGISIAIVGDDIVISLSAGGTPWFVNYVTGQTGVLIPVGMTYNTGSSKLWVYRNGVCMLNSLTAGGAVDRFTESSSTTVTLSQIASSPEVFAFVNEETTPDYKTIITGITGTTVTVPTYTMGTNRLMVFRNGLLMNHSGYGGVSDQYTEATTATITLALAAITTDVFTVFHSGVAPAFREDQTGVTGTTINLSNTYTMGNQKFLVYRNGLLMLNSLTLGSAIDRYQEASGTSITLAQAAVATDTFAFVDAA